MTQRGNRLQMGKCLAGVLFGRWLHVAAAVAAATLAVPAAVQAQVELKSRAMELTVTGRLHAQWNWTSVTDELASEFLIRRARITADLKINDFVSGRIQPDFGEGEISLKDAYVRLTFAPAFRLTVGQFKRPFDIFELTSSTQILVVERAGGIRGLSTCSGPGGICSFSRFTEKLQYSDRDIGVLVDGRDPSGRISYAASVTNGTGANVSDENGTKSYTGRITVTPVRGIAIAGNVAVHDYVDEVLGTNENATAFGGDVEIGDYSHGLHVQAGVVVGDNWTNIVAGAPTKFFTTQGIATFKVALSENPFVAAFEPLVRVSWGDPDTDLNDDEGWLFTPGLVLYFIGRNKIGANVDIWKPAIGDTEYSVKVQTYLHF